uniref:HAP1 N-terminal domain-containing protein n=1 Tax=Mesocestoides corti TaxID=53468 RepID=A0A5K3ERH0_MESCO
MEPQVEFFHYAAASNGLMDQTDIAASILDENIRLREENQRLLGQFCQQIHDIQREKETVRLRLIAVESDYDAQMKELQSEILNLREEVQNQKRRYAQAAQEHQESVNSLTECNAALQVKLDEASNTATEAVAQVKTMQQHLQTARAAIQGHIQQIESLRAEITQLKEDKESLEKKLQAITDERDCLLTTLSDAQQASALLQQENASQQHVISCQDNELIELQRAAAVLRDQLSTLDCVSPSHNAPTSVAQANEAGPSSKPHQSLLGELSDADPAHAADEWWYKHVQLDPTMTEFYEDDGIEIDDASLLAAMTTSGRLIRSGDNGHLEMDCDANNESSDSGADDSMEQEFLEGFRAEVAEIYQQLRQMCVDVSAQSSSSTSATRNRPGDWTPDQLARVEWDFRLSSLRNVLTDLRCLLQDLVAIPTKAQ